MDALKMDGLDVIPRKPWSMSFFNLPESSNERLMKSSQTLWPKSASCWIVDGDMHTSDLW
jgi:hypothetical protein